MDIGTLILTVNRNIDQLRYKDTEREALHKVGKGWENGAKATLIRSVRLSESFLRYESTRIGVFVVVVMNDGSYVFWDIEAR
jgi:hypothetical protein